jgi:glycosyltransferase involved in cell wall biosynthesis
LERKSTDPASFEIVEVPMDANYRRDKYRFVRRQRMEEQYGHEMAALVRAQQPDLVISANTPSEPQLEIAKTCSQLDIAFVPWVQDFYSVAVGGLLKKKLPVAGNLIGWWYRHLDRAAFQRAAAVISITEDFVLMLMQFGVPKENITVIPNWAPLEELPVCPRQNEWSAQHGLNDKFVFLYSGTLAMKHNPDLLRQLALRFRKDSAVQVVVISEGPGADYLAERKHEERLENLLLLPFQDFLEMPKVLASADVLVAVLEADAGIFSVPSKVLTYHCAGKPLLAAMPLDNLAARIIQQQESGICVAPCDLAGFLDAAARLHQDATLGIRFGKQARAYAEKHFDIKNIGDCFEEIALKCQQQHGPRTATKH